MKKSLLTLLFIVSAAAAFAVYYGALSNEFIWDDPIVLQNQLSAFRSVKDVFFPPPGIPQYGVHYYRPIIVLTYLMDIKLFGRTPFGFHFSVVIFHVINTILVYFLARLILKKFGHADLGALVASLLFAVHPIHTESVSWMAGRSDVVAAVFFFSAVLLYIHYLMRMGNKWSEGRSRLYFLFPSVIAFFLAACSKETALSFILLLPVIDIVVGHERTQDVGLARKEEKKRKKEDKKKAEARRCLIFQWWNRVRLANYVPFIIATLIYFILRYSALKGQRANILQSRNLLDIPKYFVNSYGFYLEKLFIPFNLKAYIPDVPGGALYTLFSVFAFLALLILAVWTLMKKREVLFFVIVFFVLTLLPSITVAVMKISETPLAERYLYMPSFSLSLIAGFVLLRSLEPGGSSRYRVLIPAVIIVLLAGVMVAFAIQTVKRIPTWKNDLIFWEDIVKKLPNEGLPHLNLGLTYSDLDRDADAEQEYIKAINSNYDDEGRSIAYNNLGNIYIGKKDYDRAEEYFKTAMSVRPEYPTPYYSMALALWRRYTEPKGKDRIGDVRYLQMALEYLNKAIQLNPQYVKAHGLLGNIYLILRQNDRARYHLQTVLKYEPNGKTAEMARKALSKIPSQ